MKCTNCQAEIEAKWKHAISSNICPYCGEKIFSDELGSLLSASRKLFDSVEDGFKYNFEDWLMSNYGYVNVRTLKDKMEEKDKVYLDKVKLLSKDLFNVIATGSIQTNASKEQRQQNQVPVEMDATAAQIRKNAGLDAMEQRRKEAASKIKSGGLNGASSLVVDSELTPADSDEIEMAAALVNNYGPAVTINTNSDDYEMEGLYTQAMAAGSGGRDLARIQAQMAKSQSRKVKGKI
jgi:Zn-finger nucleic acid-binding protein